MSITVERNATGIDWINRREYPFESHFLNVEGGRMHYVDEGQGEPILFVHGCPAWSYAWRHQIRELAKDRRCVAPDLIGFGLSDKPEGFSHSPGAHGRNLAALVNHLGLQNLTLVVHDFGGPAGFSYLFSHLSNVKRLVILNTWMWDCTAEPAIERITKLAHGPLGKLSYLSMNAGLKGIKGSFGNPERMSEEFTKAMMGPFRKKEDRAAPWAVARQMADSAAWYDDLWRQRRELDSKPITIMWGMKDPLLGEAFMNRWWHEFPLVDVQRYADAGHYLMEERPFDVSRAIRLFTETRREQFLS